MTERGAIAPVHLSQQVTLPLGPFAPRTGAVPEEFAEAEREDFVDLRNGLEVGCWEGTPGQFPAKRDGYSEICHLLSGRATLHTTGAGSVELQAGDSIVMPTGWACRWEIHEPLRKLYIIVHDRLPSLTD